MSQNIGILVLGFNLFSENWEETVWGRPPYFPGRLPRAVALFLEENASLFVISGGATKREGKSEAWWMRERLIRGIGELGKFLVYPSLRNFSPKEIEKILLPAILLEEKAQNTMDSFRQTGKIFSKKGIQKVIIVTSPDHISRALRDAFYCWQKTFPNLAANILGAPSMTFYSKETKRKHPLEELIIIEPPLLKRTTL